MAEPNIDGQIAELETLAPPPEVIVELRGRSMSVSPLMTGELGPMLRACKPIFETLKTGGIEQAFVVNPDAFIDAVAIGARIPRQELDAMPPDEMLLLAGAVWQVNADFFVQRVAPVLIKTMGSVTAGLAGSPQSTH